ncbi:GRAM domain-containing protein [Heracleum sosnowskyi]|uniref:GRAM domain-containing protein n=1 Tax=Heracleum sosnowskyi TaxID=360622 RepID=A0AAD8ISU0_9APIA|nr:GRAM domain-containing protein [Heracleum sosnowskyi]
MNSSSERSMAVSASRYRESSSFIQSKLSSVIGSMSKIVERVDNYAQDVREHVRIGSKITETVKGKLSLGAKILQIGGVKKIFTQNFKAKEEEKLLKVCQCYLFTTAGPLAGLLFLSTERLAFCSERTIKVCSPNGECIRIHYKVGIPLERILGARESENVKQPSRKYIVIVTDDNFEFWFMGFLNHWRTIRHIQRAVYHV